MPKVRGEGENVMLFVGFSLIVLGFVWILVSEMMLDLAREKVVG
ncbi:MAG: hypothetical protein ACE5IF_06310 [Candidatus Bathyarchaeia archaeon]